METGRSKENRQIRIRKARYADVDVMKKVMARAYEEEPYTLYVVLQDERRIERAEKMIETVLKYYVPQIVSPDGRIEIFTISLSCLVRTGHIFLIL